MTDKSLLEIHRMVMGRGEVTAETVRKAKPYTVKRVAEQLYLLNRAERRIATLTAALRYFATPDHHGWGIAKDALARKEVP